MRYLLQYSSFACHFSMIENPCKDTKVFPKQTVAPRFFYDKGRKRDEKAPRGGRLAPKSVLSFCPAGVCPQIGQRLENEGAQEVVAHDASEIADEGCPRDVACVPSKADLLQTHRHYAGGAADDQYRSAYARTIGQKLPEHAVDGKGSRLLQGYMPMQPATRGTLSTMLESTPMKPVTR